MLLVGRIAVIVSTAVSNTVPQALTGSPVELTAHLALLQRINLCEAQLGQLSLVHVLEVDSLVDSKLSVILDGNSRRSETISDGGHLEGTLLSHVNRCAAGELVGRTLTIELIGDQDVRLCGNSRVVDRQLVGLHVAVVHLRDVNDSCRQGDDGSINLLCSVLRLSCTRCCPSIQCTRSRCNVAIGAIGSGLGCSLSGLHVQDLTLLEVDVVCTLLLIDLHERDRRSIGIVALGLHLYLHLVDSSDGVVTAKEHVKALCPDAAVLRNGICAFCHGVTRKGCHHVRSGAFLGIDSHSDVIPHTLFKGHLVLSVTIEIVVEDVVAVVVAILPVGVG